MVFLCWSSRYYLSRCSSGDGSVLLSACQVPGSGSSETLVIVSLYCLTRWYFSYKIPWGSEATSRVLLYTTPAFLSLGIYEIFLSGLGSISGPSIFSHVSPGSEL